MNRILPYMLITILVIGLAIDLYLIYPIADSFEIGCKILCVIICFILAFLFHKHKR